MVEDTEEDDNSRSGGGESREEKEIEVAENELVEMLEGLVDHWLNNSSYSKDGEQFAKMFADDITDTIGSWKNENPDRLPEIELTQGRRIIFFWDGEMRAGSISHINGEYVHIERGVAIHIDYIFPCVYSDEVVYNIPDE